jgi:hypothetical protein
MSSILYVDLVLSVDGLYARMEYALLSDLQTLSLIPHHTPKMPLRCLLLWSVYIINGSVTVVVKGG